MWERQNDESHAAFEQLPFLQKPFSTEKLLMTVREVITTNGVLETTSAR
jgi:hypothetical protein